MKVKFYIAIFLMGAISILYMNRELVSPVFAKSPVTSSKAEVILPAPRIESERPSIKQLEQVVKSMTNQEILDALRESEKYLSQKGIFERANKQNLGPEEEQTLTYYVRLSALAKIYRMRRNI
jgi:hypothetical protein